MHQKMSRLGLGFQGGFCQTSRTPGAFVEVDVEVDGQAAQAGGKTERDPREDGWVRAAKTGDRAAFDALVEAHGRAVLRYLEGMTGPAGDAEDLAQEALFQAFRRIGTFTTGTGFRAWLLTIAYHAWVHSVRKKKVATQDQAVLATIAAPDAPKTDAELREAVRGGLADLPEDQRAVVLLRFGEGLSHAEIATITGAEVATVRWRLFRARHVLRKALKAWLPAPREEEES